MLLSNAYAEENMQKKPELTKLQEDVMINGGTERPFQNEYWDNKADGIYVDPISGKPLFSSTDKYDSGTGWPSFTRPIDENEIIKKSDKSLGMERTEVKSSTSDGHLGHVFNDGPKDKGGKRYCINSAALHFVPKGDLEKEGYGEYLKLFEKK
jgi:methionine-R-sulfoxide reductase